MVPFESKVMNRKLSIGLTSTKQLQGGECRFRVSKLSHFWIAGPEGYKDKFMIQ